MLSIKPHIRIRETLEDFFDLYPDITILELNIPENDFNQTTLTLKVNPNFFHLDLHHCVSTLIQKKLPITTSTILDMLARDPHIPTNLEKLRLNWNWFIDLGTDRMLFTKFLENYISHLFKNTVVIINKQTIVRQIISLAENQLNCYPIDGLEEFNHSPSLRDLLATKRQDQLMAVDVSSKERLIATSQLPIDLIKNMSLNQRELVALFKSLGLAYYKVKDKPYVLLEV